jgi:hypothetical protein
MGHASQHATVRFCATSAALCVLGLTLASSGCDNREQRTRAEARSFLSLYEATDHRAPIAERERKLTQLGQLSISDEAVRKARDGCVQAHRALIHAERENEGAAGKLDKVVAAHLSGEPLPAVEAESIRARLQAAEGAIADSRKRFERCEEDARGLALRFGER